MVRKSAAALMLLALLCDGTLAFAEGSRETPPNAAESQTLAAVTTTPTFTPLAPSLTPRTLPPLAGDVDWSLPPVQLGADMHRNTRGAMLPALYVSLAGLQIYDAYSTSAGVKRGATESNPLVGAMGVGPAFWVAKGGASLASILMAERLTKKRHRGQAIALMVVSNGIMAAVATSNARVLRAQR